MRTVWIIDHYASEPKHGGISRQYDFAIELAERGYNVVVITSSFSHFHHKYLYEREISVSKVKQNIHFVYLKTTPYHKNNGLMRIRNMFSFLKSIMINYEQIERKLGKPEVINGCSIHPLTWPAAYLISKKYKVKFCIEIRDLWPEVWLLSGVKKKSSPMVIFFRTMENFFYKRADCIIYSMNKGDKYFIEKFKIRPEKLFLIGQPMDTKRYDYNKKNKTSLIPEQIQSFVRDSFLCTFTGYYMTYEGVYVMLEAAKILKDRKLPIKMLFVGSGQEKEGMEEYVQNNSLDNVMIGDRISKEAIPALLKSSEVSMAHLAIEGHEKAYQYGVSKNKINEYLYSDSAVLYGFHDKKDPVATSGAGYIFEPFNAEDLANHIQKIYKMTTEERKKIVLNGKKYVLENHTSQVLTDKLENIFFEDNNENGGRQ